MCLTDLCHAQAHLAYTKHHGSEQPGKHDVCTRARVKGIRDTLRASDHQHSSEAPNDHTSENSESKRMSSLHIYVYVR